VSRTLGAGFYFEADSSNVAALIADLVQGEGSFIFLPKEFLKGVREICRARNIVLVANEEERG